MTHMPMNTGHLARGLSLELIDSDTLILLLQPEHSVLQQSQ